MLHQWHLGSPGLLGLLWATLGCSVLLKGALGGHLCKYTPCCTGGICGIYGTWATLGCSVLLKVALGARLCKYTPGCTGGTCGIYGAWAALGCSVLLKGARECTGANIHLVVMGVHVASMSPVLP